MPVIPFLIALRKSDSKKDVIPFYQKTVYQRKSSATAPFTHGIFPTELTPKGY
jgi:hypothetical protein